MTSEEIPPAEKHTSPRIGEISALVGVGAVSVYLLGLVALRLPIYNTYTNDLSLTWYAVSLVPKTMVAGQGAWQLLVPITSVLFTAFLALAANVIARILKKELGS